MITRSEVLKARAYPAEKLALKAIARQERRRESEALRELVRQEAQRRGLWPPQQNTKAA